MKINIKYIIAIGLLFSGALGCKKLEQAPLDKLSEGTTFVNEFGFQSYAWQFYSAFSAYDNYGDERGNTPYSITNDINSDMMAISDFGAQSPWISQLKTIPTDDGFYNDSYARLRSIHVMLANIDKSPLSEEAKNHWKAVGYFFRAYNYANLINLYADVPYVDKVLTDKDEDLFMPRTPREIIAKHILDDLNFAVANLRTKGNGLYVEGSNAVTPDAALAMISRFGLREGTWRKYHKEAAPSPLTTDANVFLQASADASKKLMDKYPTLGERYDLDFNSDNLAGVAGIIMYKSYGGNGTSDVSQYFSQRQMNRDGRLDLTKAAINQYLCSDGQTVFTSPLFQGDKNQYDEFRNRDIRLYYTVPPPYRVVISGQTSTSFTHTNDPRDRSYFPLMERISDNLHKTLPVHTGGLPGNATIIGISPNYYQENLDGQGTNLQNTFTGYRLYKYANNIGSLGIGRWADAPIFRMGEVLLNYAEAMYELGQFNQTVADQTINKTKARGELPPLNLGNIPNDPSRDAGVTPILWEIRRERNIELMGEGFRFDDLRRWKKMEYVTKEKLGTYVKKGSDYVKSDSNLPIKGGGNEGYISYEPAPKPNFPEYYYLYPIPSRQIVLNNKLIQNPNWKM